MKIYLNAQYKCVKVEDNTFVANSTSNFIRYYFVQNADGTLADEITESTEVYLNQEPSYVTLGFRRADGNTIQHLMATPKVENNEPFWEYIISDADGILYKKGALEVSAQFINATLNGENKIISQKVMAVAINTAHILDNIGEEAEEYYSQYEQANNEAHAALQAQITEKFNNIGVMGSLTTDNKNTLVEAINEVDEHADKAQNDVNKLSDDIGDKLSLTTDEKNTIVGAINEVDEHADTAQTTADSAIQTANNAKTVADTAKNIADSASQTANQAKTTANNASATANAIAGTANQAMTIAEQAKTIATNSVYSVSFEDIQSAVTALNGYDNAYFKVGNSIYLKQKDVPDMWVYAVASEYVEYTYTTDDDFVNALLLGTVQVGYYVLANLESTGDYDVLKNKPIINQDLSADGFTPVENTYYRHTGTTSETYTAGVVYFYNGTAYKAIDGAGGEVPTSLPATGAKITGNLPTSGWASDTPSWIGQNALTWTEKNEGRYYVQGGTEDLGLSSSGSYSAVVTIDGTDYSADVEGILPSDGTSVIYAGYFNNNNIELNIIDHCVGFDGNGEAIAGNGYLVMVIFIRGTVPSSVIVKSFSAVGGISAIISNSAIKVNSTVTMYIDYNGKIKAEGKANGSITVSADETPTEDIPYTLQVVETSTEGAFEIVNSYLPTIPETPTALPQTAGALKSGELPTSGWEKTGFQTFWEGTAKCDASTYKPIGTSKELADILYSDDTAYMMVDYNYYSSGNHNQQNVAFSDKNSNASVNGMTGISFRSGFQVDNPTIFITRDGTMYGRGSDFAATSYAVTYTRIGTSTISQQFYTISDTSITANSDILMELTDDGGVKSYSMEAGKMTVIRDTVPTTAIPYTYKVKQTNASGQFTLLNHYVPKVEIPTIPTKTSELINDSGFVSNLPTVQNVVCNDVDSATTLDTTIPCEIGDLILAQIIVRSALTLPTGWSLLRTIPAVETTYNQTLSFAYKRATSTSETLTVTQATAGRIYTNLVRLSNAVSISYIQSCEKTNTGAMSISSTKPVTPNMVIWGASSALWNTSSPYGDWTYTPSTLDHYSLPQASRQPRLGTFVDSSGAGERTFTAAFSLESSGALMCGAVEIVGDEVARKGDIPTVTTLYEDSTGAATVTLSETINNGDIVRIKTNNGNVDNYYIGVAWNRAITVTESLMVTDESDVTVGTAINIYSLRFNIQDTSLILFHYFKTNITTAGAVTITNEKANVVIRKVERIHT